MLIELTTPSVDIPQTVVRYITCVDCERVVVRRGQSHKRCDECAERSKTKQIADHHRANRVAAAALRPTSKPCKECGETIEFQSGSKRFCSGCLYKRCKKKALAASKKKRVSLGLGILGGVMNCAECGAETIRTSGTKLFCEECAPVEQKKRMKGVKVNPATRKAWRQRRSDTDPSWRINQRIRAGVNRSLHGGKAGRSWEVLVGYTVVDLMRHLERSFTKGMSWACIDKLEIDHIQPLSSFKFTSSDDPEFRAAWALSNLRMLWKKDNYEKRDKRLYLL